MELDSGVVASDKRLLWDGQTIAEERDSAGTNVTKRYFSQGVQLAQSPIPNLQSPLSLYYTRDHLGSIRELTDSTGTIQARYDYDP